MCLIDPCLPCFLSTLFSAVLRVSSSYTEHENISLIIIKIVIGNRVYEWDRLNNSPTMEISTEEWQVVEREEEEAVTDLLADRFRLCAISIAEAEAVWRFLNLSSPVYLI